MDQFGHLYTAHSATQSWFDPVAAIYSAF